MKVKQLLSHYSDGACFKVCVHDKHWHYLETPEGDTVFWVNLSTPDCNLKTLEKVFDFFIFEWFIHVSSGTLHIYVADNIE